MGGYEVIHLASETSAAMMLKHSDLLVSVEYMLKAAFWLC